MAPWWLRAGTDEELAQEEASRAEKRGSEQAQVSEVAEETREPQVAEEPQAAAALTDPDSKLQLEEKSSGTESSVGEKDAASERDEGGPGTAGDASEPTAEQNEDSGQATAPKKRRRRRRRKKPSVAREEAVTPGLDDVTSGSNTTAGSPTGAIEVEPALSDEALHRSSLYSVADRGQSFNEERKLAMFCDFENIALGVRDSEIAKLDVSLILERLLEKGKIIVKKAYADWERYSEYKRPCHEAAIELIDIPQKYYSGKNSADIKMVVDAMDLCYSKEHLDTFVLVSGDSDFSPLVSKLKENNKYVIGVGVKNSSSNLLIDNCDEFIYYEDIWRDIQRAARLDNLSSKDAEVFGLLLEAMVALMRENKEVLWGSMIKQTMQRKRPSFNEGYYGYSTFSELLEDAKRKNVISLKRDQRSGNYVVTGFAKR